MSKTYDPKHGEDALGNHWMLRNLADAGNHYYTDGEGGVWLCWSGDGMYQFSIKSNRRNKAYDEDVAKTVVRALNRIAGA